jgi:hypothetical protein
MPRQKTLISIIREIVDTEVRKMFSTLLGGAGKKSAKKRPSNGRRKRKVAANGRRKRRGPGRPPGKRKASPAG